MQQSKTNQHQQQSNHQFWVKPTEPAHSIYLTTEKQQGTRLQNSQLINFKHIATFVLSKLIIITLYFLLSESQLLDFIFITILISIDFWLTKNIYGKQLSGLRWWIELNQWSDEQQWVFQSADPNNEINKVNNLSFWIVNLVAVTFWMFNLIFLLISRNSLFWIGLGMFCFGISGINVMCFYKCRGNHRQKLEEIIEKVGLKSASRLITKNENMNQQSSNDVNFQIQ